MRAKFTNTTDSSEVNGIADRPIATARIGPVTVVAARRSSTASQQGARVTALALRSQAPGPHRLGGQDAEQVEVGRLFVVENAHLVPGPGGGVKDLKPFRSLDQAHGPLDLLAHRVSGRRYG